MLDGYTPPYPHMRLPQARGPYSAELETEALRWAKARGMMHSPRLRKGMHTMALGELAARTHPFASWDKSRIIVHWLAWYGYIDDLYDEVTISKDATAYQQMLNETGTILASTDPLSCPATSITTRATAELWHDIIPGFSPAWRERMAGDLMDWLEVYGRESQHRAEEHQLELESYLDFRQRSSSMYSVLNLVEYDQGFELPPHLVPGPYRDMMSTSVDLAAWVNDVYSIEKELALDDFHSAVIIISRTHGCTLQEAAKTFVPRITTRADDFAHLRLNLNAVMDDHHVDQATREKVRRCVLGLELWSTGLRDWTMIAGRYGVCDPHRGLLSSPSIIHNS